MRILQTLALPLGHDALYTTRIATVHIPIRNPLCFERAMGFEPTTFSLARRRTTTVLRPQTTAMLSGRECRDPGSDWGHHDFQSCALPTELSRLTLFLLSVRDFTRTYIDCQEKPVSSLLLVLSRTHSLTFCIRFDIMLGRCPNGTVIIVSYPARFRREEWRLLCPKKHTLVFP